MSTWPSIEGLSLGTEEEVYSPQIKQEFEANYVQTRRTSTRARRRWTLTWNLMSETDYQLLQAFFVANQGTSFTWVHPISGTSYTCVFSGNSIKSKLHSATIRSDVQCPIEEL